MSSPTQVPWPQKELHDVSTSADIAYVAHNKCETRRSTPTRENPDFIALYVAASTQDTSPIKIHQNSAYVSSSVHQPLCGATGTAKKKEAKASHIFSFGQLSSSFKPHHDVQGRPFPRSCCQRRRLRPFPCIRPPMHFSVHVC